MRNPILTIPDDAWRPTRNPVDDEGERADGKPVDGGERLFALIDINGTTFFADAVEVNPPYEENHSVYYQEAVHEGDQWRLDALFGMEEPNEPFDTFVINGRHYVVTITPGT